MVPIGLAGTIVMDPGQTLKMEITTRPSTPLYATGATRFVPTSVAFTSSVAESGSRAALVQSLGVSCANFTTPNKLVMGGTARTRSSKA